MRPALGVVFNKRCAAAFIRAALDRRVARDDFEEVVHILIVRVGSDQDAMLKPPV